MSPMEKSVRILESSTSHPAQPFMHISILDASRFVVGAAVMRTNTLSSHPGGVPITLETVAMSALGSTGEKIRRAIGIFADEHSGSFRKTPPHTLMTDRVIQSRAAEVETLKAIGAALVSTIELAPKIAQDDALAKAELKAQFVKALQAIDETPGSAQERSQLQRSLLEQIEQATPHSVLAADLMHEADVAYREAVAAKVLAFYDKLSPSDEFKPN